ncbi:jg26216 [Pararge aegeria aegeria]|uniref:Jg26216 protein n=1 Tax=Pararge aegeria aegeria TaxID=348720 RepID=A0A8S4QKV9_9NEOP|nr:jg26216 [Pararge aegeria aegeria]
MPQTNKLYSNIGQLKSRELFTALIETSGLNSQRSFPAIRLITAAVQSAFGSNGCIGHVAYGVWMLLYGETNEFSRRRVAMISNFVISLP